MSETVETTVAEAKSIVKNRKVQVGVGATLLAGVVALVVRSRR